MKNEYKKFNQYIIDIPLIYKLFLILILLPVKMGNTGHRIAPSFNMTYIKTTEGDRYYLYSPAFNYTGDFKTLNFRLYLSFSILFPMWASQNGEKCDMVEFYCSRLGSDLFIGISRDYPVVDELRFIPAIGYHLNGIRLRGKPEYMDFYSLTSGIGINIMTRYRWKQQPVNFAFLSIAMDFSDMLYTENKLKKGYTIMLGAGYAF